MKDRYRNPNFKQYKDYGGRGIKVCDEWLDDFKAFYDWSMKNGYLSGLQIDRIDNDGNYNPKNCRWVERAINSSNRRVTNKYKIFGELLSIREIMIYYPYLVDTNLNHIVIDHRLGKNMSWDTYAAISTPKMNKAGVKMSEHKEVWKDLLEFV